MSFILVFLADVSRSLATNNDDDEDEDPAVFMFFCHDFVCFFFSSFSSSPWVLLMRPRWLTWLLYGAEICMLG